MKKFLLVLLIPILLALNSSVPARDLFKTRIMTPHPLTGESVSYGGTAFCVPGSSAQIMTAAHLVDGDKQTFTITDWNGVTFSPMIMKENRKVDFAVLFVRDATPCQFGDLKWAKADPAVGEEVYLTGWGGLLRKLVTTRGWVAAEKGFLDEEPTSMAIQTSGALMGHSGSPVLNANGEVVGMLTGAVESGQSINVMVPVSELRKGLR